MIDNTRFARSIGVLGCVAAAALSACDSGSTSPALDGGQGLAVDVQPPAATVLPSGSVAFTAAVTGTAITTVTWSVEPAGCGTVTQGGFFTAPASPTSCQVRARATADPAVSDAATVTVTVTPPPTTGGAPGGGGTDYHVGPGQAYASIGAVPWYNLRAGDTVYIHYRADAYREKFLVSGQGTPTQWIRVRGVPGPNGELPVISGNGATTGTNNHWRWPQPNLIQYSAGPVAIAPRTDDANGGGTVPQYIEIAGLQIQDATPSMTFTAENGQSSSYETFAACVYARSPQNVLIRDNVLTNCGQGFYNWTGGANNATWYEGVAKNVTLRGNYFLGNGGVGSWTEHQSYTEALGTVIEGNRYGPNRSGAWGSQLKDRSAGTVIRYNYFEHTPAEGWVLDLVEPEEGSPVLVPSATYRQAFVYGNVFVNSTASGLNFVHWNEDHQTPDVNGRAEVTGPNGKLFFYNNTLVSTTASSFAIFNTTYGAYECKPATATLPGNIDIRNNIVVARPGVTPAPGIAWSYCHQESYAFGPTWSSPGWTLNGASATGTASILSPAGNDPSFVNAAGGDFRLAAGSNAAGIGGALAPEVTSNALGLDLTPTQQYAFPHTLPTPTLQPRAQSGVGSDAGAFER